LYNVCAEEEEEEEEEDEEDVESSTAALQSLENSITMNKMKLLKAKMEDMNLNKKVGSWDIRNLSIVPAIKGGLNTFFIFSPF